VNPRWTICLFGALLAGAADAAPGDKTDIVRDLASRIGPIIGSALSCRDIARPRVQVIVDKFTAVISQFSSTEAERSELTQLLDRNVGAGRAAVTSGQMDCRLVERQFANIEQSIAQPASPAAVATPSAVTTPSATPPPSFAARAVPAPTTQVPAATPVRGITDSEIRFGMAAAFSGPTKELGRQMKLGIDTAFSRVNEAGGVEGRMLKLVGADDGNDPARTLDAMKQLYEKEQIFGIIGNTGTPTGAVAVPYALERRMLFFGAFTGANVVRHDPPDRYVFNYRPSYAEETDATVRYLVKMRRIPVRQIAVFAQQDGFGDSGFAGVAKAFRQLGVDDSGILRLNYQRNTVDVDSAINQLKLQKVPIKAVVMVATYRVAAKFIEKTHDLFPDMIYTDVSAVGGTALADELMLLGPRYATGVIVTQVVPAVSGYSSLVLDYKNSLAKYFPGEAPDYVSMEGFISASILIQALKRAGPQLDTEKLVDVLENTRNLDLGLGIPLSYGRGEHQASHKIWGTALDDQGKWQAIELE
jgi:branched-chain amino acid transport system substrate-binding protein